MTYLLRLSACLFLCVSLKALCASTSVNLQLTSVEDNRFYSTSGNESCGNDYTPSIGGIDGCFYSSITDFSSQNKFVNFDLNYGDNGFYTFIDDDLEWISVSAQPSGINSLVVDAEWTPPSSQIGQINSLLNSQGLFSTNFDVINYPLPHDFMFVDDFYWELSDDHVGGSHMLTVNVDNNAISNLVAKEGFYTNLGEVETNISYDGSSISMSSKYSELDDWREVILTFQPTAIPLPAGIYLFLSGLVGLVGFKLRGRNA